MTLQVYTARMGAKDPDWLDITRSQKTNHEPGGHHGIGVAFAPSLALLKHYLQMRGELTGATLTAEDWARYAHSYTEEMRTSYSRKRGAWRKLLGWKRVCLLCFCTDLHQCHRHILAREILPKLGAVYRGEIEAP